MICSSMLRFFISPIIFSGSSVSKTGCCAPEGGEGSPLNDVRILLLLDEEE